MIDREEIVLDVNPDLAVKGVRRANESMEQFEARVKKTMGEYVKATDKGATSTERMIRNLEKQAALYGKSGAEKLIAQRDQLVAKYAKEEAMVNRINAAYGKMIEQEQKAASASSGFASRIKSAIQNPLQTAGEAAEGFASKLGMAGSVAVGVAVGVGVLAKSAFSLVANLGDAAEQMTNMSDRTGLTVNQVDKLQAMAKIAGINIGALETAGRTLADRLTSIGGESDEARSGIQKMGVSIYDASGRQKEMGQVLLGVLQNLGKMKSQTEQVSTATALFGRGAMELLPLIKNYDELEKEVTALGFGMDEYLLRRLGMAGDEIDKLGLRWDLLKRKLAVPAQAIVNVVIGTIDVLTGKNVPGGQGGVRAAGGWTIDTSQMQTPQQRQESFTDLLGAWGSNYQQIQSDQFELPAGRRLSQRFAASRSGTVEGMKARLKEIEEARAGILPKLLSGDLGVTAFEKEQAALTSLDREKAGLEKQLKAIEDAAKKAEEIAKQAVKVRAMLDSRKAITRAAIFGPMGQWASGPYGPIPTGTNRDLGLLTPDKGPGDAYEKSFNANSSAFSKALEQQIKYDEETLKQFQKTKEHFDELDEEAAEAADKQAKAFSEAYEKEFDRVRDSFGGLLDSMLGGARSMWDGMRRFAFSLFLAPLKMEMENVFARWWMGMRGVQGGGGMSFGGLMGSLPIFGSGSITGGPGGTGGFAGPVNYGGGGSSSGGFGNFLPTGSFRNGGWQNMAAMGGAMGGLGLLNYGLRGPTSAGKSAATIGGAGLAGASIGYMAGGMYGLGMGLGVGLGGGMMLDGYRRHSWAGVGESAAGGALAGFMIAGPIGAAVGLWAGLTVGLIGKFRKTAEDKAKEKIKALYQIDMRDKGVLRTIVETAKSAFGGNLDLAIRSPQIREMIELYAMMTGQKSGGAAVATMQPYSFSQTGGGLNYNPTYSNGSPVSIASVPSRVVLQLDPQATRDVLEGRAVDAIANNPREVQASANRATAQNSGRRTASIRTLRPSLVIS